MIQCIPKSWGFAHVCEECGAVGPIVGDYPAQRDACEAAALGHNCTGETIGCLASAAGWQATGGDLCPKCKARPPLKGPMPRPVTDPEAAGIWSDGVGFAIAAALCATFGGATGAWEPVAIGVALAAIGASIRFAKRNKSRQ